MWSNVWHKHFNAATILNGKRYEHNFHFHLLSFFTHIKFSGIFGIRKLPTHYKSMKITNLCGLSHKFCWYKQIEILFISHSKFCRQRTVITLEAVMPYLQRERQFFCDYHIYAKWQGHLWKVEGIKMNSLEKSFIFVSEHLIYPVWKWK